jgi:hypothetical protein
MCKNGRGRRRTGMPILTHLPRAVMRPAAATVLVLLSTACARMGGSAAKAISAPDAVPASEVSEQTVLSRDEARSPAGQASFARLLVRRATMQLQDVKDPQVVARRVSAITTALGGYIEESRESSGGGVHIKVRVPAAALEEAMDSVATLGHVEKRQISADDVTEQVVDLEARVATRRAIRDRLRALLERAGSIPDVISVERELARVQGELDVLERRLEYLRGSSSMAELSVDAAPKRILGPLGLLAVGTGWVLQKLFIIK